MIQKIAITFFVIIVAGLLVWQRFDIEPHVPATVLAEQNSQFEINDRLKRGLTIETADNERFAFKIQNSIITLDERTTLVLESLKNSENVIKLLRGRIVVDAPPADAKALADRRDEVIFVDTNFTANVVQASKTSFVNYDFLETVHLIPIEGMVQFSIKKVPEYSLSFLPISIKETPPVEISKLEVNIETGAASEFYKWSDKITE